jgi:hypothetical protein
VAESELRQIVAELKNQRRQIDRAVAALEAVIDGTQRQVHKPTHRNRVQQSLAAGTANGTTDKVVPFARGFKSGS